VSPLWPQGQVRRPTSESSIRLPRAGARLRRAVQGDDPKSLVAQTAVLPSCDSAEPASLRRRAERSGPPALSARDPHRYQTHQQTRIPRYPALHQSYGCPAPEGLFASPRAHGLEHTARRAGANPHHARPSFRQAHSQGTRGPPFRGRRRRRSATVSSSRSRSELLADAAADLYRPGAPPLHQNCGAARG